MKFFSGLAAGLVVLGAIFLLATPGAPPSLRAVGPRLISNQTEHPVMLYGSGFRPGLQLRVGERLLPTVFVDEGHLAAVIPPLDLPAAQATGTFDIRLDEGEGASALTVVNDVRFTVPSDLELAAGRIFVASRTTDELLIFGDGPTRRLPTCDGPRALARWVDESGRPWIVVVCSFDGELRLVAADAPEAPQIAIPVGPALSGIAVHGDTAWVSERRTESVVPVDLRLRRVGEAIPVGVDPGPLAVKGDTLLVGNQSSEDLSLVQLPDGVARRVAPAPGTPIVGGHTAPYAALSMGGKRPRAVVASASGLFFASSVGPNIGPNADRMEVSMNGGVAVIDAAGRYLRHVSIERGLPEGLAVDEARGRLYVADISTGRVVILDMARLAGDGEDALLGAVEIPPAPDTPRLRPEEDFDTQGRAGLSLHSGPVALRLGDDGRTLWVLCRFAGMVQAIDLEGEPRLGKRYLIDDFVAQPARRLGEIVWHTDVGNSRMTCDGCHPDGHTGGVLFTKGRPMRIYRSPSLRASRESAPYFTPSMLPSLRHMARHVLDRNRFGNPLPTPPEIAALAHFNETLAPLPNPWVEADGALPRSLELPGGGTGDALRGLEIFEGSCASCHPAPHFTLDQDESTRGRLHHVGTPLSLPLRPELQDRSFDPGWPAVSLVGVWDVFPLLSSGAGGLRVEDGSVVPVPGLALRQVLEPPLAHGGAASLSEQERDDLLAYLLTL